VYYTNKLSQIFVGCFAQESGGDVSKKYTLGADINGPPYLSDVDIKFFFPESNNFTDYQDSIINSLFYLISYLEKYNYLRYSKLFVGTVHFGLHTFKFFIDSASQRRIFGIRYAKDWNGLAGLLSADIKLNIRFQHYQSESDEKPTGVYNGKFVMAFFDIACWGKSRDDIEKQKYDTTKDRVEYMKIPSLGASLNESTDLVYSQTVARMKVNKHKKDKLRRIEYLKLALSIIDALNENQDIAVNKQELIRYINDEILRLDNPQTEYIPFDNVWVPIYDWTIEPYFKQIKYLPRQQLDTIYDIEQIGSTNVAQKENFTAGLSAAFRGEYVFPETRNFLTGMADSKKAKTSYRENPVRFPVTVREVFHARGVVPGGSGGGRHRRKRRGATKKKQKRRIGKTRRRR
jgi:hypothetical protein